VASYELFFRPSVAKDLEAIPTADVRRIMEKIEGLREDPRPVAAVKLSGKDYYRLRQGNYRIIYEIQDGRLIVLIVRVGHRQSVYRA